MRTYYAQGLVCACVGVCVLQILPTCPSFGILSVKEIVLKLLLCRACNLPPIEVLTSLRVYFPDSTDHNI